MALQISYNTDDDSQQMIETGYWGVQTFTTIAAIQVTSVKIKLRSYGGTGETLVYLRAVDEDGKPTGDYEPRVAFPDKDKDNKPLTLDLTVAEAVKRMKELEKYGNLFEGGKKSGLGGTGSQTKGSNVDISEVAKKDPAKYRELRKLRETGALE